MAAQHEAARYWEEENMEKKDAIGPAKTEPSRLFPPILKDRGMVLTLERAKTFCEGREGLRPASEHHRDDGCDRVHDG